MRHILSCPVCQSILKSVQITNPHRTLKGLFYCLNCEKMYKVTVIEYIETQNLDTRFIRKVKDSKFDNHQEFDSRPIPKLQK